MLMLVALALAVVGCEGRYSDYDECRDERCLSARFGLLQREDYPDEQDQELVNSKRTVGSGSIESLMALAASAPVSWATFPNPATQFSPGVRSVFETRTPNCSCKAKEKPKIDMGSQHYPRYLDDFGCDANSCRPMYFCKEIRYKIWILKQRQDGDTEDRHAPLLPERLRENFLYKTKHLAAGCECLQRCPLSN